METVDPNVELALVAMRQQKAVDCAMHALNEIAQLEQSCPLAAEVAMNTLGDLYVILGEIVQS